jgi:hypothetical protein
MSNLPDKFAALVDGRTDDGTPTETPRSFMLTRHETEAIVRAARRAIAGGPLDDLRRAIDAVNIGV